MQIARCAHGGRDIVGVVEDGQIYPAAAETLSAALARSLDGGLDCDRRAGVPWDEVTPLAPVDPHNKILCVALNYQGHIRETGQAVPENPIIFFKTYDSMIGAGAPIANPDITEKLDYEGELAIVMGRGCRDIAPRDAWSHIAGISAFNDTSARDLLRVKAGDNIMFDWYSSKCMDSATAMGPVIVTYDEVADDLQAGNLSVITRVNGNEVQNAKTEELIFDIPALVSFCASRVRLAPGDVIATGTPAGVGMFTGTFLNSGDVVEIDIAPVPVLRNTVA